MRGPRASSPTFGGRAAAGGTRRRESRGEPGLAGSACTSLRSPTACAELTRSSTAMPSPSVAGQETTKGAASRHLANK